MPANIETKRDEHLWERAKEQAKKQGRTKDYAYIMGIYQRMRGDKSASSPDLGKAGGSNKIPGGLASKKSPSDFDSEQLAAGIKVEMEHTSSKATAQEIAMDHLTEDPEYYRKLKRIEKAEQQSLPGMGGGDGGGKKGKGKKAASGGGGPFIGPRGGKWADSKHTIPWEEKKGAEEGGGGEHVYGARLRPIGFATVPEGYKKVGSHPDFPHGTVTYDKPLDHDRAKHLDLVKIPSEKDKQQAVSAAFDEVKEYAKGYLEGHADDPRELEMAVGHFIDKHNLHMDRKELADRVVEKLREHVKGGAKKKPEAWHPGMSLPARPVTSKPEDATLRDYHKQQAEHHEKLAGAHLAAKNLHGIDADKQQEHATLHGKHAEVADYHREASRGQGTTNSATIDNSGKKREAMTTELANKHRQPIPKGAHESERPGKDASGDAHSNHHFDMAKMHANTAARKYLAGDKAGGDLHARAAKEHSNTSYKFYEAGGGRFAGGGPKSSLSAAHEAAKTAHEWTDAAYEGKEPSTNQTAPKPNPLVKRAVTDKEKRPQKHERMEEPSRGAYGGGKKIGKSEDVMREFDLLEKAANGELIGRTKNGEPVYAARDELSKTPAAQKAQAPVAQAPGIPSKGAVPGAAAPKKAPPPAMGVKKKAPKQSMASGDRDPSAMKNKGGEDEEGEGSQAYHRDRALAHLQAAHAHAGAAGSAKKVAEAKEHKTAVAAARSASAAAMGSGADQPVRKALSKNNLHVQLDSEDSILKGLDDGALVLGGQHAGMREDGRHRLAALRGQRLQKATIIQAEVDAHGSRGGDHREEVCRDNVLLAAATCDPAGNRGQGGLAQWFEDSWDPNQPWDVRAPVGAAPGTLADPGQAWRKSEPPTRIIDDDNPYLRAQHGAHPAESQGGIRSAYQTPAKDRRYK